MHCAGMISIFNGSSPVADSSPSALKLERITNHTTKLMLGSLRVPFNNPSEHLHKPNLSTMVLPSDAVHSIQPSGSSQNEAFISAM